MSNASSPLPGFKLQAADGALPARTVSFGQAFLPGAVPSGSGLAMVADGVTTPVQMEVRTRHPDGSVALAQIVLPQPALAAGQTLSASFVSAPPSTAPAVDLAAALSGHSAAVDLAFADGTPFHLDVAAAARAAVANGTASYWQRGAYATQARIDVPVSGSLHLTFDLTATADGDFKIDAHFNNDLAMGASGGAVTYAATVTLDGRASAQPQLTQYQYQNWNMAVESKPAAPVNVQHDIGYIERTGLLADFDQTRAHNFTGEVNANAGRLDDAGWNAPFTNNDIQRYMPGVGGRPDIGPTTGANADWVLTQSADAAKYALDQAGAADGVPWHYKDVATGRWLTTEKHPSLWTDPRGGTGDPGGLTQQVDEANNGWVPQTAHAPDNSYIPYLLTGDRAFLDELNAEASFDIMNTWNSPRGDGQGIMPNYAEVRAGAWSIRVIQEAAWANPDGSPEKAYFSQIADNNWKWLVSKIPEWTAAQGDIYGHVPMVPDEGDFAPWQQDYFTTTTAQAAINGNADAKTFLAWQTHFLAGRFLHADEGMDPRTGVTYRMVLGDETWKGANDATVAAGWSGDYWPEGDYAEVALTALGQAVTVLGDSAEGLYAMKAYGYLAASDAPYLNGQSQFQIAPRLADGRLLTWSNITASHSAAGTTNTVQGPDAAANQLLHAGAGGDTLVGGSGVNLLYGGTGTSTLVGGAGRDYMFGGAGPTTFKGGAGANYMEAGKGRDTFVVRASDAAQDTVAGFKVGTDTVEVSGATAADVSGWISRATAVDGGTILALSGGHTLTLKGIAPSQVEASMFTLAEKSNPTPIEQIPDQIPAVMLGTGADTVTLGISEDAYKGHAQYVVTLDGAQLGGTQTAAASHASGQSQAVQVKGDFTHGPHQIGVKFLNDAWGGSSSTDRNLYVASVAVNGTDTHQSAALLRNGSRAFTVGSGTPAPKPDPVPVTPQPDPVPVDDTLVVRISADAAGSMRFVASLDGKALGAPATISKATDGSGGQVFTFTGRYGAGPHVASVAVEGEGHTAALAGLSFDGKEALAAPVQLKSGSTEMAAVNSKTSFSLVVPTTSTDKMLPVLQGMLS